MNETKYDQIEAWCNKVVQRGDDFLFDVTKFDEEMKAASKRFQFPTEASSQ